MSTDNIGKLVMSGNFLGMVVGYTNPTVRLPGIYKIDWFTERGMDDTLEETELEYFLGCYRNNRHYKLGPFRDRTTKTRSTNR